MRHGEVAHHLCQVLSHPGKVSHVAGHILGMVVVEAVAYVREDVKGVRAKAENDGLDHMADVEAARTAHRL